MARNKSSHRIEMSSVKWSNIHYAKPLSESVVFSKNAAPENVGFDKYLAPSAKSVQSVQKSDPILRLTPIEIPQTLPECSGLHEQKNQSPAHQRCMSLIAEARAKRMAKKAKAKARISRKRVRKSRK